MQKYDNVGNILQTSLSTWKWTISNYKRYTTKDNIRVYSPNFSAVQSDKVTNWRFKLYPTGETGDTRKYVSVYLKNLDEFAVAASIEWSIWNQTNRTVLSKFDSATHDFSHSVSKWSGGAKFNSIKFMEITGALTDNTLILQCRMTIDSKDNVAGNIDEDQLKDDFEKLLESEKHSDVTFVIGKKKMHLHKAILASRSPVFEGMFEYDMKENQQNTVKITDIKIKIMKEMCRYIYAGKVNDMKSIAKDLLIAADKYCIEELKIWCEKAICEQMNNDNAFEYLALATIYNAGYLKPRVYEFVTSHIKDLYEKPEYKTLDPELKDEIIGIVIGVNSIKQCCFIER